MLYNEYGRELVLISQGIDPFVAGRRIGKNAKTASVAEDWASMPTRPLYLPVAQWIEQSRPKR